MARKSGNNYAFIDLQNIHLGIQELGWSLDYQRFRIYLAEKYKVAKAFLFLGYLERHKKMYDVFRKRGYHLIFKPVLEKKNSPVKGNVDAYLVLHAMIEYPHYDKAVIVTSDGDFAGLVGHLHGKGKLETVMSPQSQACSILLKRAAKGRIVFMDNLANKLGRGQKERAPRKDGTLRSTLSS